jgi:hypothetical protein
MVIHDPQFQVSLAQTARSVSDIHHHSADTGSITVGDGEKQHVFGSGR